MSVAFRFHYFSVSLKPYPLVLRIYRMVPERPKRMHPMGLLDEEPTARPDDLTGEFKERSNRVLSEQLPEDIERLMDRLRERERRAS